MNSRTLAVPKAFITVVPVSDKAMLGTLAVTSTYAVDTVSGTGNPRTSRPPLLSTFRPSSSGFRVKLTLGMVYEAQSPMGPTLPQTVALALACSSRIEIDEHVHRRLMGSQETHVRERSPCFNHDRLVSSQVSL